MLAAAVPISGLTALQAIRDTGKVQPGQQVLIIGAAGGMGTFAVQLAKALGADVTGVCSTTKLDLVRSIGADHVIDYTREDFADGTRRYDLIVDTAGQTLRPFISKERSEGLLVLKELIEAGQITPVIDRTYPPSEAPEAIRYLEQGHARGKIVITV